MKQPLFYITSVILAITCILVFSHCTDKAGNGNCTIDSSAVSAKYQQDHSPESQLSKEDTDSLLSILTLFEGDTSMAAIGDGEEVPYTKADGCTAAFKNLMNRRGFPDSDPADPTDIGKLTLSESFKGDGLITFLQQAKAKGATEIELRFGKYNPTFLNWRFPHPGPGTDDEMQTKSRIGRLTIFLYPVQRNGATSTLVGTNAYDLGNLHP